MRLTQTDHDASEARRKFLTSCSGTVEAVPPAINLLLAASECSFATAHSDGGRVAPDECDGTGRKG